RVRVHVRHRGCRHAPERACGGCRAPLARPRLQRPVVLPRGDEAALYAGTRQPEAQTRLCALRPMPDKPSKNEDEYFARRDAELLRQQREAVHRAAVDAERRSHYMKCPKCGYDLISGEWHGVQIDQCTHCHGLWFDAGEAETVLAHPEPSMMARVFRAVLRGVSGENAGVLRLPDGWAVAFKIESHNHPSAVEPYQGAATGVGGILRDVFTMGARPVALLNSLRFGPLEDARNRYLLAGVVRGVGDYGNCVGVPTLGGEVDFGRSYSGNPLVNAMCV